MKTKIAIGLIILGIATSFGAARISKPVKPIDKKVKIQTTYSAPIGGLASEER